MFENTRTVVCTIKAFMRTRNAAQTASQNPVLLALTLMNARPLSIAIQRLFHRLWYTKIGMQLSVGDGAICRVSRHTSAMWRLKRDLSILFGLWTVLLLGGYTGEALAVSGRVAIESGGVTRSAILVEHARLKKSRRPVIIILHAGGGNAVRVRHILGLEDKARSAAPVMVYPEAIERRWGDAAKQGNSRDTAFIHDLIAKLISEGIADRHRIFIVGSASGGLMAMKLACGGADFAGVVAIFSELPADIAAGCKPAHPLPFLLILGTADPFVPYKGGTANLIDAKAELLSGNATLDVFAKAAGCGEGRATSAFADHDARDNSRAFLDKLNGCKVPVELLRIEGGGHLLPRVGTLGAGVRGPEGERGIAPGMRNRDVDAPLVIWDFLRRLGA